ncbi:MAG TPA: hypothetical protein VFA90_05320 [Terriglobales bacterium]|nr:hypothetical protein [Terriglobales bacterium]
MRKAGLLLLVFSISIPLRAQESSSYPPKANVPGNMGVSNHTMTMRSGSLVDEIEQHATSGTDVEPNSTPMAMLMWQAGSWTLMFHGTVFVNLIQQRGPRGTDKFFSTNWFMPMAQRKLGRGTLTLRTMLSFEPATVTREQYPELFQQGETAYGRPIVDGQHPHDFFMEVAGIYDYQLGRKTLLSFYAAPVGSPALGPPAYPHRASASEDPIAPLGHHLEDSTHISNDVITAGVTYRNLRLETSGFHGREPGEYRWDIDSGGIDSWAARATLSPGQNWSFQYSIGKLASPEELFPQENTRRMTVSLIYNRPIHNGNWVSMLLWGRNQSLPDGNVGNAYLLESTLRFLNKNHVWTRLENVDRTNELLLGENSLPPDFLERYFARMQAYTAGYDRQIAHVMHVSTALGGQFTWYGVPTALQGTYGLHPFGVVALLQLRTK